MFGNSDGVPVEAVDERRGGRIMEFCENRVSFLQKFTPEYPQEWKPITRDQAYTLFKSHACYLGEYGELRCEYDGIPIVEASKLLGWHPVIKMIDSDHGDGKYRRLCYHLADINFLTWSGFAQAVIICNAKFYEKEEVEFKNSWHADIEIQDKINLAKEAEAAQQHKNKKATHNGPLFLCLCKPFLFI